MRWTGVICAVLAGACGDNEDGDGGGGGGGGSGSGSGSGGTSERQFVFVESNALEGNEILAFERGDDGGLMFRERYDAGGIGITAGADQRLGPLDSDDEIAISGDGNYLYAVNSGDSTVAAFRIDDDGVLSAVSESPFDSGGTNPVGIGLTDSNMYVINKEAEGLATPSYAAMRIDDGHATMIGSVSAQPGGSPSTAHLSRDERFVFGTSFIDGARPMAAPVGQIESFVRQSDGSLVAAPGSPLALPPDTTGMTPPPPPVALNVAQHPSEALLYVAFPTRSQIGVYEIEDTGALTFLRTVPNSGKAVCWFQIDDDGRYMYTVNSVSATVSTYDLSDPSDPVEGGAIELANAMAGPPFIDAMGMTVPVTSQPFDFAFDAEQKHLYIVSQRATTNVEDLAGNFLHVLDVHEDGSLAETISPIDLSTVGVSPLARPQGVAVVTK
jgi:hypothetical protein